MSEKKITATKDFVNDGITTAKAYADEVGKTVQSSVKLYADEVGKTATKNAKSYTDTEIGKINVPTKVSELENDGVYFTADKVYGIPVYDLTGDVTSIMVEIPNKDESENPPHELSTFSAVVPTREHVEKKITDSVENRLRYRGVVATFNDLPTDATACDICKVTETGSKYIYIDSKWQKIEEVDLSEYVKSSEVMNYVPRASYDVAGVVKVSQSGSDATELKTYISGDNRLYASLPNASHNSVGGVKTSHTSLPSGKTRFGTFMGDGHKLYAFGDAGVDRWGKKVNIGYDSNVYIDIPGVAIGFGATVSERHGIAIGTNAYAYNPYGVSIGYRAQGCSYGVAIGYNTWADHKSVAIGHNAYARNEGVFAFAQNEHKIILNSTRSGGHGCSLTDVIKKYAGGSSGGSGTEAYGYHYGYHLVDSTIDMTEKEVCWFDLNVDTINIRLPDFTLTKFTGYPVEYKIPNRRVLTIRFNLANSRISSLENPSNTINPRYEEDGAVEKDITEETFGVMDKVVIEMIPLGTNHTAAQDQNWFIRWTKITA